MNISFTLTIEGDAPPEPTGPLDWFTLAWIIFCVLVMLVVSFLVKKRQEIFYPLRSITNGEIVTIVLCGTIDMFAIFVADEQLDNLRDVRHWNCALWSYWLQYPFGIAPLFVLIMRRMIYTCYNFHHGCRYMSMVRKKLLHNWAVFLILAPILVLCIWITGSGATYVDQDKQTCTTEITEKILLCLWVFICGTSSMIMCVILQKGIPKRFLDEWIIVKRLVIAMGLIFLFNLSINITGLLRYSLWRSMFTLSRSFLYLFCLFLLAGKNLYLSFKKDEEYAQYIINSYIGRNISIWSIEELSKSHRLMREFLKYCNERALVKYVQTTEDGKTYQRELNPRNMAECYQKILQITTDWSSHTREDLVKMGEFVLDKLVPKLQIPEDVKYKTLAKRHKLPDTSTFELLESQLIKDFQTGWGEQYLNERNASMLESRYNDEEDANIPLNEIVSLPRREHSGLLDGIIGTVSKKHPSEFDAIMKNEYLENFQ